MARRLSATALIGQALVLFFGALVARQLTLAGGDPQGRATTYLVGGTVLALLCLVVAGLLRTSLGVPLGWTIQGLTLASALVLPPMLIVAVIFGALWWLCLSQGRKMDRLTEQWYAEHGTPTDDKGD